MTDAYLEFIDRIAGGTAEGKTARNGYVGMMESAEPEFAAFKITDTWMRSTYASHRDWFTELCPEGVRKENYPEVSSVAFNVSRMTTSVGRARTVFLREYIERNENSLTSPGTGRYYPSSYEIKMSSYWNHLTEQQATDVMLHEMIHFYQYVYLPLNIWKPDSHGASFLSVMNRINEIHGRHITKYNDSTVGISHDKSDAEKERFSHMYIAKYDDTEGHPKGWNIIMGENQLAGHREWCDQHSGECGKVTIYAIKDSESGEEDKANLLKHYKIWRKSKYMKWYGSDLPDSIESTLEKVSEFIPRLFIDYPEETSAGTATESAESADSDYQTDEKLSIRYYGPGAMEVTLI